LDTEGVRRTLAVVAAAALVLGACTSNEGESATGPKAERSASGPGEQARKKLKKRRPTGPKKALVMNVARGAARRLTRSAIADLKRMGYWDDLTEKIFAVRISSRGVGSVPDDGRLGDSLWTYYRDDATGELGDLCDVLLFTSAVREDVARQEIYYSEGRLDHPPPTVGQFWTVLLGHELAHCTERGQKGEGYSTKWEGRILRGYGIDRIGTP
jgi:hypothetical protein